MNVDVSHRFKQYLIEQLQFESKTGGKTMEINFNHPVKELMTAGRPTASIIPWCCRWSLIWK